MEAETSLRWWSASTVAVVTGANKGIGFAIVEQLARNGITTVLTSRDVKRGEEATKMLRDDEGLPVVYHQLDVASTESAQTLAKWLRQQYGGVDILINNAAIVDQLDVVSVAEVVINTNFYGVKHVTTAILPLLRPSGAGARIINVTSAAGLLAGLAKRAVRETLADIDNLSDEILDDLVIKFYADVEQKQSSSWYPPPSRSRAYAFSKAALNAYTRLLARSLADRPAGRRIHVNAYRPGPTMTDMLESYISALREQGRDPMEFIQKHWGPVHTPEEAAAHACWLALLPSGVMPSGISSHGRKEVDF